MAPKKITTPAAAAVSAPAAAEVVAPAPTVVSPPPAEPAVEVAAPLAAADVAPAPAATTDEASDKLSGVITLLGGLQVKIKDLGTELRDAIAATKAVQKEVVTLQKAAAKRVRRVAGTAVGGDDGASRKPSGFAKPSLLSDSLCEFMGIEKGSQIARTEVTRAITKYVKDNKLFDEADKRTIKADDKLKALLDIEGKADAKVTYFNLQSHIKHHFIKDAAAPAATTA